MRTWIAIGWIAACAGVAAAADPPPGRTDGPEGSEVGKGGYPHYGTPGRLYIEPFFGAAVVDIEPEGRGDDISQTDLMYGVNVGYLMEEWLGVQVGYGYIAGDQKTSIYSVGMRNILRYDPFNWYMRLDAELYSPDAGKSRFGIAPAVGAEIVISDQLSAGLQYQHDFIFSDDSISINRFTASLRVNF
jgi:opacity protein-like surface antigen